MKKRELQFYPKTIVATSGVNALMKDNPKMNKELSQAITKHMCNDGEECKDDNKANDFAIKHMDGRVMSVFNNVDGHKIWIITDGLHLANSAYTEYPLCTILLPEEY